MTGRAYRFTPHFDVKNVFIPLIGLDFYVNKSIHFTILSHPRKVHAYVVSYLLNGVLNYQL